MAAIRQKVFEHLPKLNSDLARRLAEKLVGQVVRPLTFEWRNGGIATLNDYEEAIKIKLVEYGNSSEMRRVVIECVIPWLDRHRSELLSGVQRIMEDFGIPSTAIDLPISDEFHKKDMEIDGNAGEIAVSIAFAINAVVAVVVGYIVAAVCGGAGMAILMAGPIGFIPGVLIGALIFFYGKDAVKDWVKKQNIPPAVRSAVIWDAKIDQACKEAIPKLESCIVEQMAKDAERQADEIAGGLRDAIVRKAEEATIYIRS